MSSELRAKHEEFGDIQQFVDDARRLTSKAIVFAAYLNREKTTGSFNEAGVRLADAAIFACGGAHLELGDGSEMLRTCQPPGWTSADPAAGSRRPGTRAGPASSR